MFAIIRAGGKQHKVAKGDVIEVERINDPTSPLSFQPLLVIDDDGASRTSPSDLAGVTVTASIVGDATGPKLHVYKYKNKTGYRRHIGHRQKYTTIRIDDIKL